jgi:hypothetical protein
MSAYMTEEVTAKLSAVVVAMSAAEGTTSLTVRNSPVPKPEREDIVIPKVLFVAESVGAG